MTTTHSTFTLFHDGRFWVGVLELDDGRWVHTARHVFGPEPTDPELLAFALDGYVGLAERADASVAVPADDRPARRPNPKRVAREAARQQAEPRPSTRAQEALAHTFEAAKRDRRADTRARRREQAEQRYRMARARARARHRGH
jgi:hypothetical protein